MGFKKNTGEKPKQDRKPIDGATNMVYLAGTLQGVWMREDSAFFLIDPGGDKSKFVACSLYGEADAPLADKLGNFEKGDFIQTIGYVHAFSTKDNGEWVNKQDIRITEIKNNPPKRQNTAPAGWIAGSGGDSDIPF